MIPSKVQFTKAAPHSQSGLGERMFLNAQSMKRTGPTWQDVASQSEITALRTIRRFSGLLHCMPIEQFLNRLCDRVISAGTCSLMRSYAIVDLCMLLPGVYWNHDPEWQV